jgi:hypothetical protein
VPNGWTTLYAARRIVWHVLEHAWEMEDRAESKVVQPGLTTNALSRFMCASALRRSVAFLGCRHRRQGGTSRSAPAMIAARCTSRLAANGTARFLRPAARNYVITVTADAFRQITEVRKDNKLGQRPHCCPQQPSRPQPSSPPRCRGLHNPHHSRRAHLRSE